MTGELQGLDELRRKLRLLPEELRLRGFRSGMRTAARVVESAAKLRARQIDDPETAETIAENIAIRFSPKDFRQRGDVVFRVGVLGGAKRPKGAKDSDIVGSRFGGYRLKKGALDNLTGNPGRDTWYWRFLEFGNSRQRAQPFMRPALEQNAETVAQVAQTEIEKAIDKAVRKLGAS